MQCPKCGVELPEGAEACPACGEPARADSSDQASTPGLPAGRRKVVYAGFWLRAIAYVLDSFILGIPLDLALDPILRNNHVANVQDLVNFYTSGTKQGMSYVLLLLLVNWLYFATFESSSWQATPGKKILRLRVTDLNLQRPTFARASGRYFGKFLVLPTFLISFAMAGFTQKKQALHDIVAGCLVVRKL